MDACRMRQTPESLLRPSWSPPPASWPHARAFRPPHGSLVSAVSPSRRSSRVFPFAAGPSFSSIAVFGVEVVVADGDDLKPRSDDRTSHRVVASSPSENVILLRIEIAQPSAAPDDVIEFPFGFEKTAARKLVRKGILKTTKIGRRIYARRSAVLALVDNNRSSKAGSDVDIDTAYRRLVRRSR